MKALRRKSDGAFMHPVITEKGIDLIECIQPENLYPPRKTVEQVLNGWNVKHEDYEDYELVDVEVIVKEPEKKRESQPLTGWICPRCGMGNSPFTKQCDCTPDMWPGYIQTTTTYNTDGDNIDQVDETPIPPRP